MTGQDLIKKLADDCDLARARAEDVLQSMADIVLAEVRAHRPVTLPGLGMFRVGGGAKRPMKFRFDEKLKIDDGWARAERCILCGERAPVAGRRKCRKCISAEDRLRKRRVAAKHAKGAK